MCNHIYVVVKESNGLDNILGGGAFVVEDDRRWMTINTQKQYQCLNHVQLFSQNGLFLCRAGVFYCGPPAPTEDLRQLSLDFTHKTSTRFEFHKENF